MIEVAQQQHKEMLILSKWRGSWRHERADRSHLLPTQRSVAL